MGRLNDFTKKDRYALGFESSDANSYAHIENENIESEVRPDEVNLSSFKIKDSLERKFWGENKSLNSEARLGLLGIGDDFWQSCGIRWVKPEGMILTGSICNYNWSEYSDIDLHIIVDFKKIHEREDFVKEYFDEKKNDWNNTHKWLEIFGFPVELYVQNVTDEVESGGLYDLYKDNWIREPEEDELKPIGKNKEKIRQISADIMTKIDDLNELFNKEGDKHKIELISKELDKLSKKIKVMRSRSLEKDGEMGVGNICYKVLRRTGYLDKMWKLQTKCYDKTKSIEESKSFEERIRHNFHT